MSKRLDGTSMFTGINSGLTNAFTQLSNQYSDGITLENLNKALTNSNTLANSKKTFAGVTIKFKDPIIRRFAFICYVSSVPHTL